MAKHQAGRRPAGGLAGSTLAAALLVVAGSAGAHDPAAHARGEGHAKKSVVQKQATATAFTPGLTIARDAETGALRAPTDSEAAALGAAPAASTPIVEFVTATGAIAAQVPEDMLTYTVVSKRADGSIDSVCLPTKEAAEAAVQAFARTPQPAVSRVSVNRTPLRPAAGAPNE